MIFFSVEQIVPDRIIYLTRLLVHQLSYLYKCGALCVSYFHSNVLGTRGNKNKGIISDLEEYKVVAHISRGNYGECNIKQIV